MSGKARGADKASPQLPIEDENWAEMSGKEFAFIRKQCDITQLELANRSYRRTRHFVGRIEQLKEVPAVWIMHLQAMVIEKFGAKGGSIMYAKLRNDFQKERGKNG